MGAGIAEGASVVASVKRWLSRLPPSYLIPLGLKAPSLAFNFLTNILDITILHFTICPRRGDYEWQRSFVLALSRALVVNFMLSDVYAFFLNSFMCMHLLSVFQAKDSASLLITKV